MLILAIVSMFYSKSDLGVSAVIGTDSFNIGIVYTIMLTKFIVGHDQIPEERKVS